MIVVSLQSLMSLRRLIHSSTTLKILLLDLASPKYDMKCAPCWNKEYLIFVLNSTGLIQRLLNCPRLLWMTFIGYTRLIWLQQHWPRVVLVVQLHNWLSMFLWAIWNDSPMQNHFHIILRHVNKSWALQARFCEASFWLQVIKWKTPSSHTNTR